MMTDELILHLWEAFVGDTTLTARPLNDDDKIAFANAVLNAAKESDARRREKSATHEPVTFTPWDSLPWKPKPIGFAQRSDIELYAKVLTIRPPDAKHDVALFTRDQLQRAVSAALKEFEGMHWVDLDKALATPASAGVEEFPLPESQAARDVLAERKRQIEKEGWTPEHDDEHTTGAMATAAACYALSATLPMAENVYWRNARRQAVHALWPWDREWWKPTPAFPRRMLVKAGALILAEIERLDRSASLGLQARTEGKV